jgi:hypothetical protein
MAIDALRLEAGELAVGARPLLDDLARSGDLRGAAEMVGVLGDQLEQLFHQLGEGHHRALAEIDHAFAGAVPLRAPAILAHQEGRVIAPALVLPAQAIEHAQDAAEQRGDGEAVGKQRADIGDAHLERRKARRGPQIPPDLGRVLDQPGVHQHLDRAGIFAVAAELMRHAGAGQLVEHRQPVRFEPGRLSLPEGRGGGEREQMRQEIGRLAEQVDAQILVLDADMYVHAANHEPARDLLQILRESVVALLVGVLLAAPFGEGVGGGSDGGKAELGGDGADGRTQPDQLVARLMHGVAHAGADLDLRAQEFRADLPAIIEQRLLAFGEERRGRLREIAAVLIDEEVLLFDTEGEAWFVDRHGGAMWHNSMTACSCFEAYWITPPSSTPTT